MGKKEETICVWIHHTATILGWLTALAGLLSGRQKAWSKLMLGLFTAVQTLAVWKIVASFIKRRPQMKSVFDRLRKSGCTRRRQEAVISLALAGSLVFKLGVPVLLSKR